MKDKTPLLLMEQLIMILVFALTAALCLRGFAYSAELSKEISQREQAVFLAQTTAETLKAERKICQEISYYNTDLVPTEDGWTYRVQIRRDEGSIPGLGSASVCVENTEAEILAELTVGWQEVLP